MENLKNIVLLIDADNAQLAKLEGLMRKLSVRGRITVRRAYGNWKKDTLKFWEPALTSLGVKAEQQFDQAAHKNATDIALVVDAMKLLHRGIYDGFVIMSSDSDFTPLATALREAGAYVIGAGLTQTPESFRCSCDEFIFLENIGRSETNDEETPLQYEREAQLRAFFDSRFKEQVYRSRKEEIIQALLTSETKTQLNNRLMKLMDGKYAKVVHKEFKQFIKDLPGQ